MLPSQSPSSTIPARQSPEVTRMCAIPCNTVQYRAWMCKKQAPGERWAHIRCDIWRAMLVVIKSVQNLTRSHQAVQSRWRTSNVYIWTVVRVPSAHAVGHPVDGGGGWVTVLDAVTRLGEHCWVSLMKRGDERVALTLYTPVMVVSGSRRDHAKCQEGRR